jgi:ATP-dependent DNA helicase RecG
MTVGLSDLKGVGAKTQAYFEKLGIHSVFGLLCHLPTAYEDHTTLTPIDALTFDQQACVLGQIDQVRWVGDKKKQVIVSLSDQTGELTVRFLFFVRAQYQALNISGIQLRCFGRVKGKAGAFQMIHPQYQIIDPDQEVVLPKALIPIYPTTQGLRQSLIRASVRQILDQRPAFACCRELLSFDFLSAQGLPSLDKAIRALHQPAVADGLSAVSQGQALARNRLAFEEWLAHYLAMRSVRASFFNQSAPMIARSKSQEALFLDPLPYALTGAQQRVVDEILFDMQREAPMSRLLQGDVGSGKTVVAAIAILHALSADYQVALMAPTEILARQHVKQLQEWFSPLGYDVLFLQGGPLTAEKKEMLASIQSGEARLVVGTHALFQGRVVFANLGLVVIDEQHRFGVHQRLALCEKGESLARVPHQLVMTATPIPRTLAMFAYAGLACSFIDEMPAGRLPVKTTLCTRSRQTALIARLKSYISAGHQAYWVCPLVSDSAQIDCQSAEAAWFALSEALSPLSVGLLHGQLPSEKKASVMAGFVSGEIDVLVSTTVIEVGVNVPKASVMVIDHAERFGLSQLHQLRGRVGRGADQSYCVLLHSTPLSNEAKVRLEALHQHHDGMAIAKIDLSMRGPGDVMGVKQSGYLDFLVADFNRDQALLPAVIAYAEHTQWMAQLDQKALFARWLCAQRVLANYMS